MPRVHVTNLSWNNHNSIPMEIRCYIFIIRQYSLTTAKMLKNKVTFGPETVISPMNSIHSKLISWCEEIYCQLTL